MTRPKVPGEARPRHRRYGPAATEQTPQAVAEVEQLADILVDLELDGLFGPNYSPKETATAILARLSESKEQR